MPRRELILLAVETPTVQRAIEQALTAAGFEVEIAIASQQLEKLLRERTPSVVVLGEVLDGASGLDVCAALLERFPTLPVVLAAQTESAAVILQALQAGVSDCLLPPFEAAAIVESIVRIRKRADVTGDWVRREVRRNTQSLQQRTNELESILNSLSEGVMVLDNALQFVFVNLAARNILGLDNANLAKAPLANYITQPDILDLLHSAQTQGLSQEREVSLGEKLVFSVKVFPVQGVGIVVSLQDITTLKMMDRIKSDFIHSVSHDLRSPLTAILGYVELLERIGPLNDQQREFVRRVQSSVHSITALVNDLLDLGRIEAGFDTSREPVNMGEILRYSLETFHTLAQEKNVMISAQVSPNLPPIRGNPIRLRQLVDNLLGNAIKYTQPGGQVLVRLQVEDGQIIFQVSDTGVGIPLADQPHIFEKFYRASNTPKDAPGTGLGLAIVKSIVDNHQGRVWVSSTPGQGSTFSVLLPTYQENTTDLNR